MPAAPALEHQEAELVDGQPEVLDLLDVEPGPGRHGGHRETGQHEQVVGDRERQLDLGVGAGETSSRRVRWGRETSARTSQAPSAGSSDGWMANSSVSPVISNTLRMRGSATTTRNSRPASTQRLTGPDQHTEPRRVDERDAREVHHHGADVAVEGFLEPVAQCGRGGDVDLTPRRHDRRPVAVPHLDLDVLFHRPSFRSPDLRPDGALPRQRLDKPREAEHAGDRTLQGIRPGRTVSQGGSIGSGING